MTRIVELLPDVPLTLVQKAVAEQDNLVGKFFTLLVKEEEQQAKDGKKGADTVVTDVQCKS